jgi:hypothetical protein
VTAQFTEVLKYQGETLSLCTYPLNVYWKSSGNPLELQSTSTGCWRGYVGTWEIANDRLYLVKFWGNRMGKDESETENVGLADLFPDYPDGVFAHWFTGQLRCPRGERLHYVHSGFESKYEKDLFITVRSGVVIGECTVVNGVAQEVNGFAAGRFEDYVVPDFLRKQAD